MKIAFLNTDWPGNIGNAFIDLGSVQSVRAAMPECVSYSFSGYPRILFQKKPKYPLALYCAYQNQAVKNVNDSLGSFLNRVRMPKESYDNIANCFDLGGVVKSDCAIFSGMILWDYLIELYMPTFAALKERNVKIIFNGAGGPDYSEGATVKVRKLLKEIDLYAFISRDEQAFRCYQDLAENSYDGIDCGFFINDCYVPPELQIPQYIVLTFDRLPIPRLKTDRMVIHTHHIHDLPIPKRYLITPNTLISDSPDDYLALYSNTSATLADRVHACVVTLSFGHPARLFVEGNPEASRRMLLFKRIGADGIARKIIRPDTGKIEKEKEEHIRFLSEILAHA